MIGIGKVIKSVAGGYAYFEVEKDYIEYIDTKKIKFLVRKIERKNEHDFDIEMFPYKYDKPDYQNPEFLTLYCDIAIIRYK